MHGRTQPLLQKQKWKITPWDSINKLKKEERIYKIAAEINESFHSVYRGNQLYGNENGIIGGTTEDRSKSARNQETAGGAAS